MSETSDFDEETAGREQIGTTRGGQPIESNRMAPEEIAEADRIHEQQASSGREQLGTTRGGQPIEKAVDGV